MHLSRPIHSSKHCLPSPNGRLVAILLPTLLEFRSVDTLQTVEAITLPPFERSQVCAFAWSASSRKVLVAFPDQVHVFCVQDGQYHAVVRNPTPPGTKPSLVRFGARDTEICVCAGLGLKLSLFDLVSSKSVEISSPKFHQGSSASRGISFRPGTSHMAVLTKLNGKDVISVHHPISREVQASWYPDTVDAQSLDWTPDGRWLVVVESPSQGCKILFFAPDGNLFRHWTGSSSLSSDESQIGELGAGVKHTCMSRDLLCVCEHTRRLSIMDAETGSEVLGLVHPTCISVRDTLQVWQEQLIMSVPGSPTHTFVRATQDILSNPARPPMSASTGEPKTGVSTASFDCSANLLASQLDDSDSTLWVWDVGVGELRAVILFHAPVASFTWHPRIRELLMVTCLGDAHKDLIFVWDPLSGGPQCIDVSSHLPRGRVSVRPQSSWLDLRGEGETAGLMVGDLSHFVLVSLTEASEEPPTWAYSLAGGSRSEYSLSIGSAADVDDDFGDCNDDTSRVDDTFSFKAT